MISKKSGFTLIELVMVIILLSVLAAVAIPNFIDFRTDAKNAAAKGAVGALRSALAIARAAIALKEDPSTGSPKYPTGLELQENRYKSQSHAVLSGVFIMDPATGIPKNPWTVSTRAIQFRNSIISYTNALPGLTPRATWFGTNATASHQYGWAYTQTSGEIWAASAMNGGDTDNFGCPDIEVGALRTTEDCF